MDTKQSAPATWTISIGERKFRAEMELAVAALMRAADLVGGSDAIEDAIKAVDEATDMIVKFIRADELVNPIK